MEVNVHESATEREAGPECHSIAGDNVCIISRHVTYSSQDHAVSPSQSDARVAQRAVRMACGPKGTRKVSASGIHAQADVTADERNDDCDANDNR